jgi:multidrug efflux pump subunit AcrA (membrane-fusion protein)
MTIDKYALVTIQGKSYVFKKSGPLSFERKEVQIGHQIGNRVIILSGIQVGDEIATSGVIQLKGLSFGY